MCYFPHNDQLKSRVSLGVGGPGFQLTSALMPLLYQQDTHYAYTKVDHSKYKCKLAHLTHYYEIQQSIVPTSFLSLFHTTPLDFQQTCNHARTGGYKDTVIPIIFGIRYQYTQIWGNLYILNTRNIGKIKILNTKCTK